MSFHSMRRSFRQEEFGTEDGKAPALAINRFESIIASEGHIGCRSRFHNLHTWSLVALPDTPAALAFHQAKVLFSPLFVLKGAI
jgi:hypothetical protein